MKYILLLLLFSCSTFKNPDQSGDGVLDKAMRDDKCGLFDQFYDGCKSQKGTDDQDPEPQAE